MSLHAFVDESKRGPYLMCCYVTDSSARLGMVQELNKLRPSGARRLHMKNENDPVAETDSLYARVSRRSRPRLHLEREAILSGTSEDSREGNLAADPPSSGQSTGAGTRGGPGRPR